MAFLLYVGKGLCPVAATVISEGKNKDKKRRDTESRVKIVAPGTGCSV